MRPRHDVAPLTLTALAPLFRYSLSRDAYILRGVGAKRGPVLRERRRDVAPAAGGTERDERFARDETKATAGR